MNPFTIHTQQQGVTYVEHWFFATGIAYRLFISVVAFVAHALFPFIDIMREHDLEATITFLSNQNDWIESAKRAARDDADVDFLSVNQSEIKI